MKKRGIIIAGAFVFTIILAFTIKIIMDMLAVFSLSSFPSPHTSAPSPESSLGEYHCVSNCTHYTFQDETTYEEYHYSQPSLTDNPFFQPVAPDDMEEIRSLVGRYESLVKSFENHPEESAQTLYQSYRYDLSSLSADDYYYLKAGSSAEWWDDIDLYIFDTDTMVLYRLNVWL